MSTPLLASTALSLLFGAAPFADVFVDVNDASCATGTGGPLDPVCSIAAGIAAAQPGDTIRIAPGTYVENVVIGMDLDLVGTGGAAVTIVDGGGSGSVITINAAVTVSIDGLTVTNGNASTRGGGIASSGTLTLSNSTISGNTATSYGGGVSSVNGSVVVVDSTISANTCPGNQGGGLDVRYGDLTISTSSIRGNSAYDYGGGIYAYSGTLTITDSTISENMSTGSYGGGIECMGDLVMSGSTISGNSALSAGGGLELFGGGCDIRNCTISGNSADYGGGLNAFGSDGSPRLLANVTITDNTAYYYGGGVYNASTLFVDVHNSLIAGNTVTYLGATDADTYGNFTSLGFNLIGTGGFGFVNGVNGDLVGSPGVPLAPLLGPLQDNGGLTETHALLTGSPAFEAGDPLSHEPVDQRGVTRPQGAAPDIGAYELGGVGGICNGDGGDQLGCTDCPCGNNAVPGTVGGCLNSALTSSRIEAAGSTSVSLPSGSTADLRFTMSGGPPASTAVLLSGAAVAPTNVSNPCLGLDSGAQSIDRDGLRCAVQSLLRHGNRQTNGSGEISDPTGPSRVWGGEAQPTAGIAGQGGFVAGQTRYFQVTHRDDPSAVCMRGLNTSQAVEVLFTP